MSLNPTTLKHMFSFLYGYEQNGCAY